MRSISKELLRSLFSMGKWFSLANGWPKLVWSKESW